MRFPSECCRIHRTLRHDHSTSYGGAVQGTRPVDVGTVTAQSGRRNAVIAALTFTGGFSAVRQRLRGRLCDCADRSAPSPNRIDVRARFRAADAMGLVAVEAQRPRAHSRSDNALHSLGYKGNRDDWSRDEIPNLWEKIR